MFLNTLIQAALRHRMLVVAITAFLVVYGAWSIKSLPIDVFPDLNRPQVVILTEAEGMAPEDVESLVTVPIEAAMGGMPSVIKVRSTSAVGLSLVFVDFDWGTDVYRNRQLVSERLAMVQRDLPSTVRAVIGPITSIMGDVQLVGLTATSSEIGPMDLRTWGDWVLKKRLLAIPGVSQVTVMGGLKRQYQIEISAEKIRYYGFTIEELEGAFSNISKNSSGGFLNKGDQAHLVRNIGMVESIEDIGDSLVGFHLGQPIFVKDIAVVKEGGPAVRFGDASINGKAAVVLTVRKQPEVSTLVLTDRIAEVLEEMEASLPEGIALERNLFRQAQFIETSVANVRQVLQEGALITAIVLFLFLLNFRTTIISLTAIPLSLLLTFIVFKMFGMSINTMTLGGLAIAIGELVDDAIVDVENVFRRLKEHKKSGSKLSPLKIIYLASSEVRNSIVFATIIVISVFMPLFYLSGIEGRFFIPLGIAYIVSLVASLVVSLTVTPVMCSYLLPQSKIMDKPPGGLVRFLKDLDERVLGLALSRPKAVILGVVGLAVLAALTLPFMGTRFLPPFQETTATVMVVSKPGTSLEATNAIGRRAEEILLAIPEIKSASRRTGRAREDEHAHEVNVSEIDVDFHDTGRHKTKVLDDIRKHLSAIPDISVNVGQPLSHRIDHMMSGVSAEVAIKIFGPNLSTLRRLAAQVSHAIQDVEGLVDLQVESQTLIPETKVYFLRHEAGEQGVMVGGLTSALEMAIHGKTVGQVIEDQRITDIVARFDESALASLEVLGQVPVRIKPDGTKVRLDQVADIYDSRGPNAINRENQRRRIVVQGNVSGNDTGSVVRAIQSIIAQEVDLPEEYFVSYDGQFKSQQEASFRIGLLGAVSLVGIFIILWWHFASAWLSAQVLVTIPFAMIGALMALFLGDRTLSIASLIGLITLCGISARNTIMMLSHYIYLVREEGEAFTKEMVVRGSLERLIPVLMTSLTAIVALIPLACAAGETGKEILHPLSVVIIGGLISSTLLDIVVTPTIFYNYGRRWTELAIHRKKEGEE